MIVGRYVDINGIRTYFESGEFDAEPVGAVVCVHSAGQDSTQWRYVIEELVPRGVRAMALDLPGHGKSSLPAGGPIEDLGEYADFVWAFIQEIGLERPAVTGCSIGGCISLQVAIAHGEALTAVVAAAATDHNPTVPWAGLELARADAGIPGWADRAAAYAAAATGERCPPERRADLSWRHRCGDSKVANGDLRGWNTHDVRGKLASVACPLTVVVGEEDFYLPADRVAALREELGEDRIIVLPGIGHYPMIEWDGFADFLVAHTFGAA